VLLLGLLDVWSTLTGTSRRRRLADSSGAISVEPTSIHWRRIVTRERFAYGGTSDDQQSVTVIVTRCGTGLRNHRACLVCRTT
jgi:hypothetical protein